MSTRCSLCFVRTWECGADRESRGVASIHNTGPQLEDAVGDVPQEGPASTWSHVIHVAQATDSV
jgi:hypothetical protein